MVLKVNYFGYLKLFWKSRTKSCFEWSNIWKRESGVQQVSILGPLLFVIYINDLPDGINSLCKIFADDTSLFSKFYDIYKSASKLNAGLEKISYWNFRWKMQFNPDPNKETNEVIFSRKSSSNNLSYPIKFNNNDFFICPHQKHLGIVLNSKLNFSAHVDQKIKKGNRLIGLIRWLFSRQSSLKCFTYNITILNLPQDLILTVVIFYMIYRTMKIFRINYKTFSIEPASQ